MKVEKKFLTDQFVFRKSLDGIHLASLFPDQVDLITKMTTRAPPAITNGP